MKYSDEASIKSFTFPHNVLFTSSGKSSGKHVDCGKLNFILRLHKVNVKSETIGAEKINLKHLVQYFGLHLSLKYGYINI